MLKTQPTQKARVLALLQERGAIGLTALESLELVGTMRLAAYVKFLKKDGWDIATERVKVPGGKSVARYRLMNGNFRGVTKVAPKGLLFDISQDAAKM